MAEPAPVTPVKLLVAILYGQAAALEESLEALERQFGEIDFSGDPHAFDMSEYYREEMGENLIRRLVSFAGLVAPESIRAAKLTCNRLENRLQGKRGRRANLDIGYLDHHKIVLASVKAAGQKIHLGDGVWADLVGRYQRGRYRPFEWTFPDFRDGRYDRELARIRETYLAQLRRLKAGAAP